MYLKVLQIDSANLFTDVIYICKYGVFPDMYGNLHYFTVFGYIYKQ